MISAICKPNSVQQLTLSGQSFICSMSRDMNQAARIVEILLNTALHRDKDLAVSPPLLLGEFTPPKWGTRSFRIKASLFAPLWE